MIASAASTSGPVAAQWILASMEPTLRGVSERRLARSCNGRADAIRFGPAVPGLERAEVYLATRGFEPHRHDTYVIGITTTGVQTFRYRGERQVSLPGQLQILHPDEMHDGVPGTDDGFGYRAMYVAPQVVHDALGGQALPFVREPVHARTPATRTVARLLADVEDELSDLARVELVAAVADMLRTLARTRDGRTPAIDGRAIEAVRDHLAAHAREHTTSATLEEISGLDRFTIARQFRRAFGTSPDRYRTLRRLELARAAIERGRPLVQAAAEAGFADQSHMTRQFKKAYGLTPARWAALRAA
jgi:AraC-like DNA-binding protein